MDTTLIIMAAGLVPDLEKGLNNWQRWGQMGKLLWITLFTMQKKQGSIK